MFKVSTTTTTTVSTPVVWTCSQCQAVRTKPEKRMPSGWKRRSADIFCDACWGKRYVLRAITVPVVAPVDMKWEELGGVCVKKTRKRHAVRRDEGGPLEQPIRPRI